MRLLRTRAAAVPKGIVLLALLALSAPARAKVTVPKVIADHMVLQRGRPSPLWGWAAAGEVVKVSFRGKEASATADADGKWKLAVEPGEAGGPFELTISGEDQIKLSDVLVGEVWVCSGQSNMQWPVAQAINAEAEIAASADPQLRLIYVERKTADAPQNDVSLTQPWAEATPESVKNFSAVAYFFGRDLRRELKVPIGLIHTSWGGTPAEAWTSKEKLEASPALKGLVEAADKASADYKAASLEFMAKKTAYAAELERVKSEGTGEAPAEPKAPGDPRPNLASRLYNSMIAPLVPYGIQGAIWYQGESNAGRAYQYRELFQSMITDWRDKWGQGDFPFLFVQLANFQPRLPEPADSDWAELREAQSMALDLPSVGQASAIDIGEAADIHPKNKQEVGRRLALNALRIAYGTGAVASGPTYRAATIKGGAVEVAFDDAGGLKTSDGAFIKGFAVAGADRKFHWAQAQIQVGAKSDTVVVSCPDVPNPVAVRYGWANNPEVTLVNGAGLPTNPFRSDDWPCVTRGK